MGTCRVSAHHGVPLIPPPCPHNHPAKGGAYAHLKLTRCRPSRRLVTRASSSCSCRDRDEEESASARWNVCTVCVCACACMQRGPSGHGAVIWSTRCQCGPPLLPLHPPQLFSAAAVVLSGDTPRSFKWSFQTSALPPSRSAAQLTPGRDGGTTNHKINFGGCSISKEINFCDQWIMVSLWHYVMN